MGGRTLPTECEHGVVLDWGDFGPDPDDGQVGVEPCRDCELAEALKPYRATVVVEWQPSASMGEADAVRKLIERWCGRLMERLLAYELVDPTIELDFDADPNVKVTRDDLDGGWVAERIDLPGCISQGDTEAEAVRNLADAAEAWLTVESKENPDA